MSCWGGAARQAQLDTPITLRHLHTLPYPTLFFPVTLTVTQRRV